MERENGKRGVGWGRGREGRGERLRTTTGRRRDCAENGGKQWVQYCSGVIKARVVVIPHHTAPSLLSKPPRGFASCQLDADDVLGWSSWVM